MRLLGLLMAIFSTTSAFADETIQLYGNATSRDCYYDGEALFCLSDFRKDRAFTVVLKPAAEEKNYLVGDLTETQEIGSEKIVYKLFIIKLIEENLYAVGLRVSGKDFDLMSRTFVNDVRGLKFLDVRDEKLAIRDSSGNPKSPLFYIRGKGNPTANANTVDSLMFNFEN